MGRLGHASSRRSRRRPASRCRRTTRIPARRSSQLIAEKASPVADITYLGVTFGIQAKKDGVVTPLQAGGLERDSRRPEGRRRRLVHHPLRHARPDGQRRRARRQAGAEELEGPAQARIQGPGRLSRSRRAPSSATSARWRSTWRSAARSTTSTRAIKYFKELQKNEPIVPKQTSYARVLSGEIPILFDYDFNAYRGKYKDKAQHRVRDPDRKARVVVPYVMSLVNKRPERGQRQEGARLRAVGRGPGDVGAMPTCGRCAPTRHFRGSQGEVPAGDANTRAPRPSTYARWRRRRRRSSSAT